MDVFPLICYTYFCFNFPLYQNFMGSGGKDQEEGSVKGVWSMCSVALQEQTSPVHFAVSIAYISE